MGPKSLATCRGRFDDRRLLEPGSVESELNVVKATLHSIFTSDVVLRQPIVRMVGSRYEQKNRSKQMTVERTILKASLASAIREWATSECEEDHWAEGVAWWDDKLEERMAEAAMCVVDGSVIGQDCKGRQESE